MVVENNFNVFSKVTEPGEVITANPQGDLLTVEVLGSATAMSLAVLGQVDYKQDEYTPLTGINLNGWDSVNTITKNGIYQFPLDGIARFKIKLNSVTGAVSVFARVTKGE